MRVIAGLRRQGKTTRMIELLQKELEDPEARPVLVASAEPGVRHYREIFPPDSRVVVCTRGTFYRVRGLGPSARVFIEDADALLADQLNSLFPGLEIAAVTITPAEVVSWS